MGERSARRCIEKTARTECHIPLLIRDGIMRFHYTMHDGDVGAWNLIHSNITRLIPLVGGVCQEEEVATIESRFHGATVIWRVMCKW